MSLKTVTGRKVSRSRFYVLRGSDLRGISKGKSNNPSIHILDRRYSNPNKAHKTALDTIMGGDKPSQSVKDAASNSLSVASNVVKMSNHSDVGSDTSNNASSEPTDSHQSDD